MSAATILWLTSFYLETKAPAANSFSGVRPSHLRVSSSTELKKDYEDASFIFCVA